MGHLTEVGKPGAWGQAVSAQIPTRIKSEASQQVQQGVERYQAGDYSQAIALWQQALTQFQTNPNLSHIALVQENLARAFQQIGEPEQAIAYWRAVIAYYQQQNDLPALGRMLTEQAQTYLSLGQSRQAIALLCGFSAASDPSITPPSTQPECLANTALAIARQQRDQAAEIAALGSLGEAYRLRGDYDRALIYLQQAQIQQAQTIALERYQVSILNSLGNTYAAIAQRKALIAVSAQQRGLEAQAKARKFEIEAKDNAQKAGQSFQLSLEKATAQNETAGQLRALMSLIGFHYRTLNSHLNEIPDSDRYVQQALDLLDRLPDSAETVNATIILASLPVASEPMTAPLAQCPTQRYLSANQAQQRLDRARLIAQAQHNLRSESFALGALGHFYECQRQYPAALQLTQNALTVTAGSLNNFDSAYLWEWQTGRILKAQATLLQQQGKLSEVDLMRSQELAAYQRAYTLLEAIRNNILGNERDIQLDFRDAIEPIYRQLAQLRLELASQAQVSDQNQELQLTQALATIDSLRLAELQNYFGSDCSFTLLENNKLNASLHNKTAIISSIILNEDTAIILNLPNGQKKVHWLGKNRETVEQEIINFRDGLILYGNRNLSYDTTQAHKLYRWFIQDFEPELTSFQIKTLIFIQDGILRTIPMAALYDGKTFLIEKYAIDNTPSLRAIAPQSVNFKDTKALILGVTQAVNIDQQRFSSLTGVPVEIEKVQAQFPNHKVLVDEQFNQENLKQELTQSVYPIIHIATHAQFGFVPEDTFLVTGNNKIAINQLETTLRTIDGGASVVELLTLSACQTAVGDDRAALGLAGVALQTGVKSVLASLWSVSDTSTVLLISEFYRQLVKPGVSKAEALQAAQVKLIKAKDSIEIDSRYSNPAYWSAFVLIGNWL